MLVYCIQIEETTRWTRLVYGLDEDVAAAAASGTGMLRQLPLSVKQLAASSASPKLFSLGLQIG